MKVFSKIFIVALSLFIVVVTGKIYLFESEKVLAYESHMSSLANMENIEYISYEDQVKQEKADAAAAKAAKEAQEKAEKEEQERILKEQEEAKKEAEKEAKIAAQKQKEEAENTVRLDAKVINQLPKYKYGCESVSLTMMLNFAGVNVTEDEVISKVPMDPTPIEITGPGKISKWGNPEKGFVGDITGAKSGYSIDPVALAPVVNEFLPGKTLDLTGCDMYKLVDILKSGRAIVVWVNKTFEEPAISYTWTTSDGITVNAYKGQHAVLLTGLDTDNYYYNDPYTGEKDVPVSKAAFENVWVKMGKKALTYYK